MAANLRIGTVGIPAEATAYTVTGGDTGEAGYPLVHLLGSHKADIYRRGSVASGNHRLNFDLGSGATKTADFLYIAKASMLMGSLVNAVRVRHHPTDDYASATEALYHDSSTFITSNLVGPGLDDYLATFTETAARRWWYVNYFSTGDSLTPHAKVFLGKSIDPGLDPTAVTITRSKPSHARRRGLYTVDLTWKGLTSATAQTLSNTISSRRRYQPVVLFTTSYDNLLMGHKVLFGKVTQFETAPVVTGVFEASMTFEEMP